MKNVLSPFWQTSGNVIDTNVIHRLLHKPPFCSVIRHNLFFRYVRCQLHFRSVMMTSSKWKHFPRYWPFVRGIHRSPVNSPHKGRWRGDLIFSLMCAWLNGWVNNREAGGLRRHRTHYDVSVMVITNINFYSACIQIWASYGNVIHSLKCPICIVWIGMATGVYYKRWWPFITVTS